MTQRDRLYAELMLLWSRTLTEHGIYPFERWLEQRSKR